MTAARVAELHVTALASPPTSAEVSELHVTALAKPPTAAEVFELHVTALAYIWQCTRRQCQVWTITRRDGTVLGFTTHDEDVDWLGVTHQACASLSESASESASDLGSVGNIEMTGVIASDAISAEDLYAGLYDDAYVEAWVIPWGGAYEDGAPFRIAAGYMGKVTRGEFAYNAEVLGPGARLQQAALVDFYTPACRWPVFGDGVQCPVDVEARKLAGVTVTGAVMRSLVEFTEADPGGSIWNGGKVRWLTGRNAGVVCQTDTVDFTAGTAALWDLAPFPPQVGDTFDLLPGCPRTKSACHDTYAVFESFGGFPDVPGPDALQSNVDSLYTGGNG